MSQRLGTVSLLVRDYDEAIAYYAGVLGFRLVEDTPLAPGKRWVLVAPPGPDAAAGGACLLLARAKNDAELAAVGRQAGGRVFYFCTPMILPGITPRFFGEESSFLRNPAAKTTERWRFSVISMATNGICSNSARRLPGVARDLDWRLIRLVTLSLWPPPKPDASVFLQSCSPRSTSV